MPVVLHVVGARPNFVKAAPVIAALARRGGIRQRLVHTGQHYDHALSRVFFDELGLPEPDHHLDAGGGSHAAQTAAVLVGIERVLRLERPDLVVAVGDVNSTLAAALAAAKLDVPVAHLEAGLRSFDRRMPEEINRVVTDHVSSLLLAPSATAAANLAREGIAADTVATVGNVMIDTLMAQRRMEDWPALASSLGLEARGYAVLTLHRPANVDDGSRLGRLVRAIGAAAAPHPVVFPVHPRTARRLASFGIDVAAAGLRLVDPLPYRAFLAVMDHAAEVFTDSGGIQAETTVLDVPCYTLRDSTEWPETIEAGTNTLAGDDAVELASAVRRARGRSPATRPPIALWDGRAGERAAAAIADWLGAR
jgi:UDP-N-acetylglucosamine 2-epimerase (non-hydrolysing)